jgi:hypothetical protein
LLDAERILRAYDKPTLIKAEWQSHFDQLLAELANGKEGEFPKTVGSVFTTDHKPSEDTDEVVADLLAAMSALQVRALAACARMAEDRDAAGA